MTEIFQHGKCALEEDVISDPKVFDQRRTCQRCGEIGTCNVYETTQTEGLKADFSGALFGKVPLATGILMAEREVAKSIPDMKVSVAVDREEQIEAIIEVIKDEVQSEDAEIPEEVVPAEQPTDESESVTEVTSEEENSTKSIDDQIAELQAKKAALEK